MPHEHQPSSPEHAERSAELDVAAAERLKELEKSSENLTEHAENQAKNVEQAREKISHHETEPEPAPAAEAEAKPTFVHRLIDRTQNYHDTMLSVQKRLKPASRNFSRFIHSPAVDKAAEVMENTVMRPSVALGAGLTALVVGGFFYYFARTYGYSLRGSELIIALVAGGLIGLLVEAILRALRPQR